MPAPLPSEFRSLVPADPSNPTCAELRAIMVGLPTLLEQWWSAWFASDGSLSEEFTVEFCALPCNGGGDSSSSSTSSSP